MKTERLFVLLITALMLLPWQAVYAETTTFAAVVRSGGAPMFDAPNGTLVKTLEPGDMVTPVGKNADAGWVAVTMDGTSGWIAADRLIVVTLDALPVMDGSADAAPAAATPDATVPYAVAIPGAAVPDATPRLEPSTNDGLPTAPAVTVTGRVLTEDTRLNVRAGPGVNYAVLGKAEPGETLMVTGVSRDGLWLRVERSDLSGGSGWVAAEYVALTGDVEQLPAADADASAAVVPPTIVRTASSGPATNATAAGLTGTLVFQTNPGGTIYAYQLATGALQALTHGFDPAISPDGTQVAFTRDGGEHGLYLITTDGTNEHVIFNGRDQLSSPRWSPDGAWIVFVRGDERETCILMGGRCVSGSFGGGFGGGGDNDDDEDDSDVPVEVQMTLYHLAVVDVNGENYRDVPSLDSARAPDWTVDGILYQSEAGMQRTFDKPSAASELVITDYLKPFYDDPAERPGGGLIVYQGKEASHTEIFGVNPDGSGVRALTHPATTLVDVLPSNVAPAWSPDGQHIVFLSNREANGEAGTWRIWVMDADGSNQHSLPINVDLNYTFGAEQAVSWGPAVSLASAP